VTDREELDRLIEAMPITWACVLPGLQPGVDNEVDALLTVNAAQVLDEPTPPTGIRSGVLRDVQLSLSMPPGITVQALSRLTSVDPDRPCWDLPDLGITQSLSVALRFHVPAASLPALNEMRLLARARLTTTPVITQKGPGMHDGGSGDEACTVMLRLPMGLPVLSDADRAAIPTDEETRLDIARLCGQPPTPRPGSTGNTR